MKRKELYIPVIFFEIFVVVVDKSKAEQQQLYHRITTRHKTWVVGTFDFGLFSLKAFFHTLFLNRAESCLVIGGC